jgi:hypothetical protein
MGDPAAEPSADLQAKLAALEAMIERAVRALSQCRNENRSLKSKLETLEKRTRGQLPASGSEEERTALRQRVENLAASLEQLLTD